MENLKNCKRCGKLFLKVTRQICPDCLQQEEEEFSKVKDYLDENPSSSVAKVSSETGVSQNQIKKFIREGRLLSSKYSGVSTECQRCGKEISEGKYCDSCQNDLQKGFEAASQKEKKEEPKTGGKIHIKDRLNRRDK